MINTNVSPINRIHDTISNEGNTLRVIRPASTDEGSLQHLLTYIGSEKTSLDDLLYRDGAVLFRGFGIGDRNGFLQVKEAIAGSTHFDYVDGNSPRTKISHAVYTSTEYPREFPISMHSELSYSTRWPSLLFFYCKTPASEGGETPIADCRHILQRLGRELTEKFEEHGVKYTRFLSGSKGIGKTWMDTFETEDRQVVEEHCRSNGIAYAWEGNSLCLSQQGPGVIRHPVTGEKVWFNQANQFHPSGLPADIRKALTLMHGKNLHRFPQYAFYGNGEEIQDKDLQTITQTSFDCALKFPWEKDDLLVLDNLLMSHGRMPFKGQREILVSMC